MDRFRTGASSQFSPGGIRIDAQHPAPVGPEQPHGQLTDQAEAGHHDRLAHGWLQETNALQRDRANHGERRLLVADFVRDARTQIDRDAHHLGMLAVARHPIADLEPADAGAGLQDDAHVAVAERQRLIELVPDGLQGGNHPVGADLVEHRAQLVRLLAGFLDQAGLAEVEEHALGAGRDQRAGGAEEHVAGFHVRARDLGELDFAGCEVLKDLPHGAGFSSTAKIFARKFASAANRFTTRSYVSPATKRALEATA